MHTSGWIADSLSALTAIAIPDGHGLRHAQKRDTDTFNIDITNNCPFIKHFAIYQITSGFQLLQQSEPVSIDTNCTQTIAAPYKGLGMRLSGHAEWGVSDQWAPQALFEFGYSEYNGMDGTAYDLSMMEGCESDVGLAAYPQLSNDDCPNKICAKPADCDPSQAWTKPDQSASGSPADTVCYHGKTGFTVVFCP